MFRCYFLTHHFVCPELLIYVVGHITIAILLPVSLVPCSYSRTFVCDMYAFPGRLYVLRYTCQGTQARQLKVISIQNILMQKQIPVNSSGPQFTNLFMFRIKIRLQFQKRIISGLFPIIWFNISLLNCVTSYHIFCAESKHINC